MFNVLNMEECHSSQRYSSIAASISLFCLFFLFMFCVLVVHLYGIEVKISHTQIPFKYMHITL